MQKKTLEERNERVRKIIEEEIGDKYSVFFRKSNVSNSYYYIIGKNNSKITLRFSDHKSKTMKSFDLSRRVKPEAVHRYVRRKIKALEILNVNNLMSQLI